VVNVEGCGHFELYIDGEQKFRHHIWRTTPNRVPIQAEKGKSYHIEVRFSHIHTYNANLKINVAKELPIDYQQIISKLNGINKVIFVGGISPALEGEEMPVNIDGFKGGDRTHIELPAVQRNFLKALKAAGKQVIFVNCSGSCIALEPETETCDAIVQAWYAGQEGGTAVADVLFGDYNPSGKLPVTFYKNSNQLPDYEDYSMKGRTYRYFDDALFPFGYGLSYTQFELDEPYITRCTACGDEEQPAYEIKVGVRNVGKRNGGTVVQVYLRNLQDPDGPLKSLRAFQRTSNNIKPGETCQVSTGLTRKSFEFWDSETNTMRVKPGKYEVLIGTSSQDKDLKKIIVDL
jgi:beta-glucosidase